MDKFKITIIVQIRLPQLYFQFQFLTLIIWPSLFSNWALFVLVLESSMETLKMFNLAFVSKIPHMSRDSLKDLPFSSAMFVLSFITLSSFTSSCQSMFLTVSVLFSALNESILESPRMHQSSFISVTNPWAMLTAPVCSVQKSNKVGQESGVALWKNQRNWLGT